MNLFAALKLAPATLRANLGRSLLTMLGIIIGITAVTLVVTLGESARGYILNQFEGIGANTVIVRPGRQPTGPTDAPGSAAPRSIGLTSRPSPPLDTSASLSTRCGNW